MAPRRKQPFSGKAKREQLKEKKQTNHLKKQGENVKKVPIFLKSTHSSDSSQDPNFDLDDREEKIIKLNHQPSSSRDRNRYVLQFYKESKIEIEKKKEEAKKSILKVPETDLEISFECYFPTTMDIPKRPPWSPNMSRVELDLQENKYFREYVNKIEKEFGTNNLSYFELNLETWRQLWRVLEMSDIVLIIVDVRYAALMFPPSVYKFVCEDLKKNMILVLNKIDLVSPDLVVAWKHYFMKHYPTLNIITFTSLPFYNLRSGTENKSGMQVRRRKGKMKMAAEGAQRLYEACKVITQGKVDLTSWAEKISEEINNTNDDEDVEMKIVPEKVDTGYQEHIQFKGGTLTIGCIGQPNVGKSSLMNAVMGKKVVSVSRTPGHTKHFQTIYLTSNVIFCDCPGLVFPSTMPRTLQILDGAYPISQVREPYTPVKYLAERLDLPKLLNIQHPENDDTWSAMDICEGWARKRGFFTAKAARPDIYRGANNILRMALDGKICLCFKPPGYFANLEHWKNHSEVKEISWIQAKYRKTNEGGDSDELSTGEEEKEEEEEESESDDEESSSRKPAVRNMFDLLADTED